MAVMRVMMIAKGLSSGSVMPRKACQALAPSRRAASMMSIGTALIAADSTTIANPAWIHTITTMRKTVFSGASCRKRTGSRPTLVISALSRPICSCADPRYS